jgi:AraC-like DNA-binding protein
MQPSQFVWRKWDHALTLEDEKKELEELFDPFVVTPIGKRDAQVDLRYARVGPVAFADLAHATPVRTQHPESRSGYHVKFPLSGSLTSQYLGTEMGAARGKMLLYRPDGEVSTRFAADTRVFHVRFERTHVERLLESQVGERLTSQISFAPAVDQSSDRFLTWVRMFKEINEALKNDDSVLRNPMVAMPYTESLVQGLLLISDHPYRELLNRQARPGGPTAVRVAIDLMEAAPERPLTTSVLAAEAHVSIRTLQESFQRHLAISPMGYLRNVRLRRAREDLRDADPVVETVTSIAHRWGFTNRGRFAAEYQTAFDELPSVTLRSVR